MGNKKDISSLLLPPSSTNAMKSQICFMSLDHMQLKNIDARRSLNFRHLMLEVSYSKSKIITRTTINLGLSKNREIIGDRFKINLKDLSDKIFQKSKTNIYDDHDILLKAFTINNRVESLDDDEDLEQENLQKQLIGAARISTAQFRQFQNTELKIQVAIPVPRGFARQELDVDNQQQEEDEEDKEVDDFANMADSLLNKMNQDLQSMQEAGKGHQGAAS
jgi:hypothetical protein